MAEEEPKLPPPPPLVPLAPPPDDPPPTAGFAVGVYACPHCGGDVAVDPDEVGHGRGPFVVCPHCGAEFAVVADAGADEDDRAEEELRLRRERERELELSGMRIRQVATTRRAAIRARSYLLIGTVACAGVGVQAIIQVIRRVRAIRGWDSWTLAYAVWGFLMWAGAVFFLRRWVALGRELARPMLDEPTEPPDFSTLGSDTERWRHLDDVQ